MASTAVVNSPAAIQSRVSADDGSSSQCSTSESNFRELDDAFLQTQAKIWLGEVLHARFDDQTAVCDLLADGEVLFAVTEIIWRMLVDTSKELSQLSAVEWKSGNSTASYMKYSKVDTFLQICKNVGLAGIDLFIPSDVVDKKNTRKVCMCIRSLSKRARARKLHVPDFDSVTCTIAMPTNMVGSMRRSWERTQSSSLVSSSQSVERISRTRSWQRKSGSAYSVSNDSSFDGSDEVNSNTAESHRENVTSQLITASPGLMRNLSPARVGPEFESQDLEGYDLAGENMSPSLCESVGSPCSQHDSDCQLDNISSSPVLGSRISGKARGNVKTDAHSYEDGELTPVSCHLNWVDGSFLLEDCDDTSVHEDNHICNGIKDFGMTCYEADYPDVQVTEAGDKLNTQDDIGLLTYDALLMESTKCGNMLPLLLHSNGDGLMEENGNPMLQAHGSGGLMHQSKFSGANPLANKRVEDNSLSEVSTSPIADQLSILNECRDYFLYDNGICVSQIYTEIISGDSSCRPCGTSCNENNPFVNQTVGATVVRQPSTMNADACTDTCSCMASVPPSEIDVQKNFASRLAGSESTDSCNQIDKSAFDSSIFEPIKTEENSNTVSKAANSCVTADVSCQNSEYSTDTAAVEGKGNCISCDNEDGCYNSSSHSIPVENHVDSCLPGSDCQPAEKHQLGAAERTNDFGELEVDSDTSCPVYSEKAEEVYFSPQPHVGEALNLKLENSVNVDDKGLPVGNDCKDIEGATETECKDSEDSVEMPDKVDVINSNDAKDGKKEQNPRKLLLKSFAGGTAIVGVVFFLMQLRNGRKKTNHEATGAKGEQGITGKEKEKRMNLSFSEKSSDDIRGENAKKSSYPAERLRF